MMSAPFSFDLPPELAAREPPERRGIARDEVRLMVIDRLMRRIEHTHFNRLPAYLRPGDLLVFNTSRTLPASLVGCETSPEPCIEVRLAEHLPDDSWLALLLCQGTELFSCNLRSGVELSFGYRVGRPIRYSYAAEPWDLDYYQTVYAREPGSSEMPSAGRAFTWRLLFDLKRRGIEMAYVMLHTGLSTYMDDELDARHPAAEEEYFVGQPAAEKINLGHRDGGRIIAVGTTVVRTLESVADHAGVVHAGHGYTRLHVTADYRLRTVDGLLTGLHEPTASHLDLLTAFLPAEQIRFAYEEAVQRGYLWHEFGDLNLIV
jgi:S-adenosylmethionine:tRNA ribosyltransferase-isomerase